MGRIHLFELEDQPWFPAVLRDGMTAYISTLMRWTGMLDRVLPKLVDAVRETGVRRVVDLGSGAGEPAALLADALHEAGLDVRVTCTDLYPNVSSLASVTASSEGRVDHLATPVDAAGVPPDLVGMRTLFNAFHHLEPARARRVLADAHAAGQPIAIVETVDRSPAIVLGATFIPVMVMALVPFFRPFRWSYVLWTYVLPVLPLVVAWDGFVSCLRIHRPSELRELVDGLDGFTWEISRMPVTGAPIFTTVLIGVPR